MNNKTRLVSFRVTQEQYQDIAKLAASEQLPLSIWLRRAVFCRITENISDQELMERLAKPAPGFGAHVSAAAQRGDASKKLAAEGDACLAKATEYFAKINQ